MTDTDNEMMDEPNAEGEPDESSVIRELRGQVKDLKQQNKGADEKLAQAVAEAQAQVTRDLEVRRLVDEAGYPKLADVISENVEGEVTAEAVTGALEDLGLPVQGGTDTEGVAASLEGVANLGQQLATAAGGGSPKGIDELMAEANSAEEIAAIMSEAGLSTA